MRRIYDFMCLKCWYSWKKNSSTVIKKGMIKCPKCKSVEIDILYDINL